MERSIRLGEKIEELVGKHPHCDEEWTIYLEHTPSLSREYPSSGVTTVWNKGKWKQDELYFDRDLELGKRERIVLEPSTRRVNATTGPC
jgi:hypothetical protein